MENINIFSSNENTMFSKLNRLERIQLLNELDNFFLTYRDTLNFPTDVFFGSEIEYNGINPLWVDFYVNETLRDWQSPVDWVSTRDASVFGGGEVNSPIMSDDRKYWLALKDICQFLKNGGADPLVCGGTHVHVWAQILGDDYNNWRKFFKLYTIFENILYRFGYGDKVNGRESINFFAKPVADILLSKMWRFNYAKSIEEIPAIYPNDTRGYGLNLKHVNFSNIREFVRNTIEFRFCNATTDEVILQNYINVLIKLLLAAKNSNLDEDYLDYLLGCQEQLSFTYNSSEESFYRYQTVCFLEALIFVDLVFDNNLDKAYFLKQYLKSFQMTRDSNLVLAKSFVQS